MNNTTTTTTTTMRAIPEPTAERLRVLGARAKASQSDAERASIVRQIDGITDELAAAGIVHPRTTLRPEFCPTKRAPK